MFKPIEDGIGIFNRESSPSPTLSSEKSNHKMRFYCINSAHIDLGINKNWTVEMRESGVISKH